VTTVTCASAKTLKPIKDVATENEVIKLYNQALKFSKAERNVHARVLLEKAASYDPTSCSAYIHAALSEIYHDLGNPDRAIQEAQSALRFDPSMKNLYYNLGLYCKDANRYSEGILYLQKFSESASGERKQTALSLIESLQREQVKMASFSNNDPDYLGLLMAENSAHHWPASRVPLKVYIEPSSNARGFRPEFVDLARNGFITWYQASGKKLSFNFVDNINDADINVEWTDGPLKTGDEKYERMKAGLTTTRRRDDDIEHSRIQIRTVRAFSKEPEPSDRIKETCLHEIGHALGLNGHSSNTADIMYFGNTARQLPALTKRDKATMARLYQNYAPYPMVGVDTSFPYPAPQTDVPRLTGGNGGYDGGNSYYDGTSGGMQSIGGEQSASNADDPHVAIPADEAAEVKQHSGLILPPTPAQAEAEAAGANSSFDSQHVSDSPSPPINATAGGAPMWSPPGASSGMPVQSWQNPAGSQAPPGVPWTPNRPAAWPPGAVPTFGSAQAPNYASPNYAQPQMQPPVGQAWQSAPAPYYPPNTYPATQAIPPAAPYNSYAQQQPAPPAQQTAASPGPEQAPAAANQNPIMQFAQQFFPPKNGQQGQPGPTPGQVVDHVLKLFQPQQQQPPTGN